MASSSSVLAHAELLALVWTDSTSRARAEKLFGAAYEYLGKHRGASPSLLGQEPSAEASWAPCIVWLLLRVPGLLGSTEAGDTPTRCLPLSKLLDASGISLVGFFTELPVVLNKLRPWLSEVTPNADAVDSALRLREWQETLVSLTQLANKYKDLFWHMQRSNSSSTAKQPLLRAGWLAFLLIKAQLLPGFPDLVSCLELMVGVLNMLLASEPISEQQLQELQQQSPAAIAADGRFSTLKALSQEAKVELAKTKALMPQIEAHFRSHLEEAKFSWLPQPLPAELPHPQAAKLDTCCSLYLEGLTSSQQQLGELVFSLDAAYQAWYEQQGEIDEREFLMTDFGGLASPRTLPGASIHMPATALGSSRAAAGSGAADSSAAEAANGHAAAAPAAEGASTGMAVDQEQQQGAQPLSPLSALAAAASSQRQRQAQQQQHHQKPPLQPGSLSRRGGLDLQGLQSPLPSMHLGPPGPATPITQAMGSVSWLRSLAQGLAAEPSPALQRYMAAAGADAGRVLVERVKAAAEGVFMSDAAGDPMMPGGLQGLQHGLAQERQDEGIKLYWHVLEAMLKAEEGRAGLPAAGALLTRWSFHQCLLACSFEVVAASYRMGLLSFPAIPAKLGLKPFDLSKMIGPFVKAEPSLPRELKRHLFTVEEKILESLGWAPGSSFYKLMRAATGQQQQQQHWAAAAAAAQQQQQPEGDDAQMADAEQQQSPQPEGAPSLRVHTSEQQQELQQEAAAAAAVDASQQQQPSESGTPSAAAASDLRRRSLQGIKRGSETGSAGDPMDMDASRGSRSPSVLSAAAKRHRGQDGRNSSPAAGAGAGAAVSEDELPLPRALGAPPKDGSSVVAAAGGDPSALAVLHDYCKKVLKLAAFRLVAVSEGLDFSPMTRESVVAHVHELLSAALYQNTYLFYSRHLDTLLLACLYGFCKVNRLQKITFREIITHYKKQAHAKQEVFRTVVLQQTDPQLVMQQSGDIIAFYNAVFVPAMKGMLLTISHPADAAAAAASSAPHAAAAPAANGMAADASKAAHPGSRPSPLQTALQLTSAQQPQQQQGWGTASATSPGGSAYRALSIPEAAGAAAGGPGSGTSLGGVAGLSGGSSLLGGLGGPLSVSQHFAAGGLSHGVQTLGGSRAAGSSAWAAADDGAAGMAVPSRGDVPMAAAAAAAAAGAPAAAAAAGSAAPSRLSRLSRAGGGSVGVAAAGEAVQMPGGLQPHPKAAAASTHPQQSAASPAAGARPGSRAADAVQQQDQGSGRQRSLGFRSSSEPQSPSFGAVSGDARDSSTDGQPGSSLSPNGPTGGTSEGAQQGQQYVAAGRQATAAATTDSPSAGLATLLQALDTKSGGPGAAAGGQNSASMASGGASAGH